MKVIATSKAVSWFGKYKITEGKEYDFPEITLDNGEVSYLNPSKDEWEEEFIFKEELTEPQYEVY